MPKTSSFPNSKNEAVKYFLFGSESTERIKEDTSSVT